jgi:hypothetical protein
MVRLPASAQTVRDGRAKGKAILYLTEALVFCEISFDY